MHEVKSYVVSPKCDIIVFIKIVKNEVEASIDRAVGLQ